jgi:hypothetical protein
MVAISSKQSSPDPIRLWLRTLWFRNRVRTRGDVVKTLRGGRTDQKIKKAEWGSALGHQPVIQEGDDACCSLSQGELDRKADVVRYRYTGDEQLVPSIYSTVPLTTTGKFSA